MKTKGVGERKVAQRNRRRAATDGDSCLSNVNESLLLHACKLYLAVFIKKTVNSFLIQSTLG